jgi:hypothetical protein
MHTKCLCTWTFVFDVVYAVCTQAAGQIERVLVSSDVRGKADIACIRLTQQVMALDKASSYKLVAQVWPYALPLLLVPHHAEVCLNNSPFHLHSHWPHKM